MGCSTALFLARRGIEVTLYDAAPVPFAGASRWNEGKIHLGFLYSGDPSLRTARRILPGGLVFRPLLEDLLDCKLENVTETDDTFLVHRDSLVGVSDTRAYFETLIELIRSHAEASDYLVDLSAAQIVELSQREVGEIVDPEFVTAGFVVPERSIATQWVADRFVDAVAAESGIELRMATRVLGVDAADRGRQSYRVDTHSGAEGPFDAVVNALWEGRPRVDSTLGLQHDRGLSHRYRLALFIETRRPVQAPSVLLCTGAFGDIKNYNGREFYVSWYPAGLVASGEGIDPPKIPQLNAAARQSITDETLDQMGRLIPSVGEIRAQAEVIRLEGGWVFAQGEGELGDPRSTLHRRDRIGIKQSGTYFSVDTGKYSVAPWLALQVAKAIAD